MPSLLHMYVYVYQEEKVFCYHTYFILLRRKKRVSSLLPSRFYFYYFILFYFFARCREPAGKGVGGVNKPNFFFSVVISNEKKKASTLSLSLSLKKKDLSCYSYLSHSHTQNSNFFFFVCERIPNFFYSSEYYLYIKLIYILSSQFKKKILITSTYELGIGYWGGFFFCRYVCI